MDFNTVKLLVVNSLDYISTPFLPARPWLRDSTHLASASFVLANLALANYDLANVALASLAVAVVALAILA